MLLKHCRVSETLGCLHQHLGIDEAAVALAGSELRGQVLALPGAHGLLGALGAGLLRKGCQRHLALTQAARSQLGPKLLHGVGQRCFVGLSLLQAVLLRGQRPLRVRQLLLQQLPLVRVARKAQLLRLIRRRLELRVNDGVLLLAAQLPVLRRQPFRGGQGIVQHGGQPLRLPIRPIHLHAHCGDGIIESRRAGPAHGGPQLQRKVCKSSQSLLQILAAA
mmetsp:Transcript_1751/g.5057  ORF Transcript_1751/g.5057 Transcript_1751/m.5057 type:complete len:220 (+) Transcript_1751:1765-2424(+)